MHSGFIAAALIGIAIFAIFAIILVDDMPAFDDRVIFFIEVALAVALGLLVFWYSRQSDRTMKSNLDEVRSMLRRNEKAKQIRRMAASRTLHSTIISMLDTCNTLVEMADQPNKMAKTEWVQFKSDLTALHESVKASADRLGTELEHAGYLDDRAYDDISTAVEQLEDTISVDDKERIVYAYPYHAILDALIPIRFRLERRLGLDPDSPPAMPMPAGLTSLSDRLKIRLDRTDYYPNAVIRASVSADEPFPSEKVTVAILDENLNAVAQKTKKVPKQDRAATRTLAVHIKPRGLAADKQYIARATCGGLVSEEMFAVDQSPPVVETDKPTYMVDEDMLVTVIDRAADTDSTATEHVGDRKESKLVIKSPHGTISGYRLKETGRSTGVFQGLVRLMGVRDDGSVKRTMLDDGVYVDKTQGTGDDDGVIACAPDNLIQIKYTNEFGTGDAAVFASGFAPAIDLDRDEYPCTGSARIQVILPGFSPSGDGQPATIGDDRRDCWVAISTGEGSLDGYLLEETGPGSGIFVGTVSLTGLAGMRRQEEAAGGTEYGVTRGPGPHDGMLACGPDDAIRVSIKSAFAREVRVTAPTAWHIGEIQMSKATYLPGEEVAVRVTDRDMSVSHDRPDEFHVRAWSDSDREGIPVTVSETSHDSGVFEGRFRTGDGRSRPKQSILEAADGDTVHAEYIDKTLPSPHSHSDAVEIVSLATITTKKKLPAALARLVVDYVLVRNKKTGADLLVAGDEAEVAVRVSNPGQEISFDAVFQVTDLDGAMADAQYQPLSAKAKGRASHRFSWIPAKPGIYSIHLALLKGMDDPAAYAPSVFKPVQVLDAREAGAGQGGDRGGAGPPAGTRGGGGLGPAAPEGAERGAGRARRGPERRRHGR